VTGLGPGQRLRIGVDRDEVHALEVFVDHAVHGVTAAAADADDLHPGALRVVLRVLEFEDHSGHTPLLRRSPGATA
jgi:hypothetical protein